MASMYSEWVKQRYVSFGAAAGEVVYVGDPIDVGDWEEVQIQVDVMSSNAANDSDVTWNVQTCIAADNYPKWGQARCARRHGAMKQRARQ